MIGTVDNNYKSYLCVTPVNIINYWYSSVSIHISYFFNRIQRQINRQLLKLLKIEV